MLRTLCLTLVVVVLVAAPSSSQAGTCGGAPAVALDSGLGARWDDCYGAPGARASLTPACDTNEGAPYPLVLSFRPANAIQDFVGVSLRLWIAAGTSRVPDWWQVGSGGCRVQGIDYPDLTHPVTPSACTPIFSTAGSAGGWIAETQALPTRYLIRMDLALPAAQAIEGGRWYHAGTIAVSREQSIGEGACAGCEEPACMYFLDARLYSLSLGLVAEIYGEESQKVVSWSGGIPIISDCPFACGNPPPCPTRNATWGQMKALYR